MRKLDNKITNEFSNIILIKFSNNGNQIKLLHNILIDLCLYIIDFKNFI